MGEKDLSLYTMESAYRSAIQSIVENGGELTEELEKALATIPHEISRKMDGYAYVMKRLKHDREFFADEAKKYQRIAKGIENAHDRMNESLKEAMDTLGKKQLEGERFTFSMRKSTPKTEYEEAKIPVSYKLIETVIDKEKIREDLKLGFPIAGVTQTPSYSLTITPNRNKLPKEEVTNGIQTSSEDPK